MATLNKNSQNRQSILDKMSKYVKEYSKKNKVVKYLEMKKFKDSNGLFFDGLVLNKSKLFEHTSFFKKYNRIEGMITGRGERTKQFYTHMKKWFSQEHWRYVMAEEIIYKLFNEDNKFTEYDLEVFNHLYKELNRNVENTES